MRQAYGVCVGFNFNWGDTRGNEARTWGLSTRGETDIHPPHHPSSSSTSSERSRTEKDLTVQLDNDNTALSAHFASGTVPSTLYAPWHWHPTTAPVHRHGNQSSTSTRRLSRMIQLISIGPGFQPTSVCARNPDCFHDVRLPTEVETEAWGRSLEELAWGS